MADAVTDLEVAGNNAVDRAIEAIAEVLSFTFALSVVVTIYDVIADVVFKSPTV